MDPRAPSDDPVKPFASEQPATYPIQQTIYPSFQPEGAGPGYTQAGLIYPPVGQAYQGPSNAQPGPPYAQPTPHYAQSVPGYSQPAQQWNAQSSYVPPQSQIGKPGFENHASTHVYPLNQTAPVLNASTYNDFWWGVAFWIHVLVIVIIGFALGVPALTADAKQLPGVSNLDFNSKTMVNAVVTA
jgi:hypothetical protein